MFIPIPLSSQPVLNLGGNIGVKNAGKALIMIPLNKSLETVH